VQPPAGESWRLQSHQQPLPCISLFNLQEDRTVFGLCLEVHNLQTGSNRD
jgi:hypothetical protein